MATRQQSDQVEMALLERRRADAARPAFRGFLLLPFGLRAGVRFLRTNVRDASTPAPPLRARRCVDLSPCRARKGLPHRLKAG